jgi:Adenylyl/Guanylyl and SMODS C-terminal sensor domain/Second Messenger Oligonucleotide or Dinucleotide Synthetase domain
VPIESFKSFLSFDLNAELQNIVESLDIPPQVAEQAISTYDDVAQWLGQEDSPLRDYSPNIYAQGSFRLGTIIRPLAPEAGFDVDLVCRLDIPKERTTQADLKKSVGDRLRKSEAFRRFLTERRRCWTLDYPERFHLDVLPAIPDPDDGDDSILITDTDLRLWQFSNPIAYSQWFFDRMLKTLTEARALLAKSAGVSIEEIPEWRVRTPLQRAVQLLKRHRDVQFKHDDERRPVSIIITTLAANAYDGEGDIESALTKLVRGMPEHIENRKGKWWVSNPAHPDENFADKWNESPDRRTAFLAWLERVSNDIGRTRIAKSAQERRDNIAESFGIRRQADGIAIMSKGPAAFLQENVPALDSAGHVRSLKWPERELYKCGIRGNVYRKRGGSRSLWPLSDRPVPKEYALKFEAQTNAPLPYEVHWQVTNTGREAADARGLRGDFYPSDAGPRSRWETTLYAGTHWVEAFVIKDGVCVARSGHRYVRIKA